jgi:RND family efflux transporter MFP subunit
MRFGALLVPWSLVFCLSSLATGQDDVTIIELAKVTSGKLDQEMVLAGELLPFQQVELRAKVTGFVENIPVDRGSRVAKGDLIALLRAPEIEARTAEAGAELAAAEANLAEAEARLATSESTYERLSKASETPGVVAGNDLLRAEKTAEADRARASALGRSVEAARAALASIEQMTAYLRVTAPFGGVVTERRVDVGSLTGPDASSNFLVRLEQVDRLRLVTPVPESQVASIVKGSDVHFSTAAYPDETFTAVVSRPALSISPETRTMAVEADVENRDGRLAPGMYAEVSWPLGRGKDSLFVPRTAVAETTERVFVIRVRDGRAEWIDVRRGVFQGDLAEVFGDLTPGDVVVARASDEIRPGTSVQAR